MYLQLIAARTDGTESVKPPQQHSNSLHLVWLGLAQQLRNKQVTDSSADVCSTDSFDISVAGPRAVLKLTEVGPEGDGHSGTAF